MGISKKCRSQKWHTVYYHYPCHYVNSLLLQIADIYCVAPSAKYDQKHWFKNIRLICIFFNIFLQNIKILSQNIIQVV